MTKNKTVWNVWHRIDDDHFPDHVAQYSTEQEAEAHAVRLMSTISGGYDNYPGYIYYDNYTEGE